MKEEPHPNEQQPVTTNTKSKPKKKRKEARAYVWPIKAAIISLALTCVFSFGTELVLGDASVIVAVVLLIVLIFIAVLFDMIGVAVAGCDPMPLNSMAARKIKGAKHALALCQKADIVGSVCNDIVGDSIGIISGACGAALALALSGSLNGMARVAVTVAVSAVIAALTIGGKAAMKRVALKHSTKVVLLVGRLMAVFVKEKRR